MSEPLNLPQGPSEYIIERCPYCNRRLAEWFDGDDHVTILHGKAGISMTIAVGFLDAPGAYPAHPVRGSSYCLRLLCRVRRRLSPLTPEVP